MQNEEDLFVADYDEANDSYNEYMYEDPLKIIPLFSKKKGDKKGNDFKDVEKYIELFSKQGIIRQYDDMYEFCVITNYDKIFSNYQLYHLRLKDIFVSIIRLET